MNLTDAAVKIKKSFKYFIAAFFLYYLIFFVLFPRVRLLVARYLPEKDPATLAYDKLPKLTFESKQIVNTAVKYELNTKGGQLPIDFPKKMVIYRYREPQYSFQSGRNAEEDAALLGFNDRDLVSDLKGDVFKWHSLRTNSSLTIELITNRLFVDMPTKNVADMIYTNVIDKEKVLTMADNIFQRLGRFDDTYKGGHRIVTYGRVLGTSLIQSFEKEEANIARVDLFRRVYDDKKEYIVLGPDPREGNLNVTLGTNSKQADPLNNPRLTGVYWEVNVDDKSGTYPIYFISDVWNIVKDNRGVMAGIYPKNKNPFEEYEPEFVERVLINKIYLAYYESRDFQKYMQPIYVFEGNYTSRGSAGGDIVIYYPAVKPEFIAE